MSFKSIYLYVTEYVVLADTCDTAPLFNMVSVISCVFKSVQFGYITKTLWSDLASKIILPLGKAILLPLVDVKLSVVVFTLTPP